jgi:hypothetical protein
MPTPEQQRLYTRLSGQLQAIGLHHFGELPSGATSLLMKVKGGKVIVECHDGHGKNIGTLPNDKTSAALRSDLDRTFSQSVSPDPDGVVAIITAPTVTAR